MEIVKHYRDDENLRRSFNELAIKTFGINFEDWYQNGFWGDNYEPYSVNENGRIVANVSVNRTDMLIDGKVRKLYQLGTVMTDESYRGRGYIRAIMEVIDRDIGDADAVYLFGSDSVKEFYPKFGFIPGTEHICTCDVRNTGEKLFENVPMRDPDSWNKLKKAIDSAADYSACQMVGNTELIFFYVSKYMQDCVYYCRELDTWVIAETDERKHMLHNVFSSSPVPLKNIIAAFGTSISRVELGFTPLTTDGFECSKYRANDCNFFIRGSGLDDFADKKLRIPSLSHA